MKVLAQMSMATGISVPATEIEPMSQVLTPSTLAGMQQLEYEFSYRPVPIWVPVAWAFCVLSVGAFMWEPLVVIPLLGCVPAVWALLKIRRLPEELSGGVAAWGALCALLLLFGVSVGMHSYAYATEVPEGYKRVHFASDISAKGLEIVDGEPVIPAEVQSLEGEEIFLKGYMYPTKQVQGIRQFVLCKDMGECCFGGQPKPTDMVLVAMSEQLAVNYTSGMVSIAGTFHTKLPKNSNELSTVYWLEGKVFSAAKTSY